MSSCRWQLQWETYTVRMFSPMAALIDKHEAVGGKLFTIVENIDFAVVSVRAYVRDVLDEQRWR